MYVPGHSYEDCKLLKKYSKKYYLQWPHKYNEAHSGRKTKRGKSVELDSSVKEENIMEHSDPIPKKKKEKLVKKRKSESAKADPKDCENTYGIEHFKIGEATHDSNDSK